MDLLAPQIEGIDSDEVLRYLGRRDQEVPENVASLVADMSQRCLAVARPRACVALFEVDGRGADVKGVPFLGLRSCAYSPSGADITAHLDGAVCVGMLAATLGAGVDRELRRLAVGSTSAQVVFDACATTLAERVADAAEARLVALGSERGLYPNWRYSPGYGDFGLDQQAALLRCLDAQRQIGLTLTSSSLMVPTKSVTALIGLFATPQATRGRLCAKCQCFDFCTIRLTGRTCRG